MDGYEVCKKLKENKMTTDIPVIFVTAKTKVEEETQGFEFGAVDYITKPIRPPIVKARIKTRLELKQIREDLKKQNEILKENARLREDVERMTHHDLKSPLTAVIGVPNTLMNDDNLTSRQIKMLKTLEQAGYSMLTIINSSINLLKMETGRYKTDPAPVDVLKIIDQIKNEMSGLARSKDLPLDILVHGNPEAKTDTFFASGEEVLCYSMLANLIKNALEASIEGERVTVALDDEDDPTIRIHNNGTVPEDMRNRFFAKYATSKKKSGTGLGTYSAQLIARTMGGSINFESSEEKGTTLTVRMPKVEP